MGRCSKSPYHGLKPFLVYPLDSFLKIDILEDWTQPIPPTGPSILPDLWAFLKSQSNQQVKKDHGSGPKTIHNSKHILDIELNQTHWNSHQSIQIHGFQPTWPKNHKNHSVQSASLWEDCLDKDLEVALTNYLLVMQKECCTYPLRTGY